MAILIIITRELLMKNGSLGRTGWVEKGGSGRRIYGFISRPFFTRIWVVFLISFFPCPNPNLDDYSHWCLSLEEELFFAESSISISLPLGPILVSSHASICNRPRLNSIQQHTCQRKDFVNVEIKFCQIRKIFGKHQDNILSISLSLETPPFLHTLLSATDQD